LNKSSPLQNSLKIYKSPVNPLGLLLPPDRDVDAPAVRDVDAPAQISNVFWIPKTFQRFLDVEGEFLVLVVV
jgi:hypothetical protein